MFFVWTGRLHQSFEAKKLPSRIYGCKNIGGLGMIWWYLGGKDVKIHISVSFQGIKVMKTAHERATSPLHFFSLHCLRFVAGTQSL